MHILRKYSKYMLLTVLTGLLACMAACAQMPEAQTIDNGDWQQEEIFSITREDERRESEQPTHYDLSVAEEPLVITEGGDYLLTGSSDNTVIIRAQDQNVHLFLDGVQIETGQGSAIWVESAGKLFITLVEGSTNILADSARYEAGSESRAAVFSVCDLTVNGAGRLSVYGYYEDAIYTKDVLKILGGDLFVQAKGDALRGSDGILLRPEKLQIEAEESGIRTANSGKNNKGTIQIASGEISVIAGQYAIESAGDLRIHDCSLYCKSVVSDYQAEGDIYLDERCLANE